MHASRRLTDAGEDGFLNVHSLLRRVGGSRLGGRGFCRVHRPGDSSDHVTKPRRQAWSHVRRRLHGEEGGQLKLRTLEKPSSPAERLRTLVGLDLELNPDPEVDPLTNAKLLYGECLGTQARLLPMRRRRLVAPA